MTPGQHTVRVVYTELTRVTHQVDGSTVNRFRTAEASTTFDVMGAQIAATVQGPVVEGGSGTLSVSAIGHIWPQVPTHQTELRSWDVIDLSNPSAVLASGTCPVNPCYTPSPTVPLSTLSAGPHTLRVRVVDESGTTQRSDYPVGVDARSAVALTAPTRVTYGTTAILTVTDRNTLNGPVPGMATTLQLLPAGASVWRSVDAAVTDANGVARFTVKPPVSGTWRALVAAKPGVAGAGTSASRWTTVVRSITLSGVPTSPARGHRYVLTGKVGPTQLGERVNVQTLRPGGTWRTVSYAFTDRYGVVRPGLTFTQGVTYVRLVAAGNASYATGVSRTATAIIR